MLFGLFNDAPDTKKINPEEEILASFKKCLEDKDSKALQSMLEDVEQEDYLMHEDKFKNEAISFVTNNIINHPEFCIFLKKEFDINKEQFDSEIFRKNLSESITHLLSSKFGDSFELCTILEKVNNINKNFHPKINISELMENSKQLKRDILDILIWGYKNYLNKQLEEFINGFNIPDTILEIEEVKKAKQEGENIHHIHEH